jgi:hypothetical protein
MKLLALILAFAGYADLSHAQNTEIPMRDGSHWTLDSSSVRISGSSLNPMHSGIYYPSSRPWTKVLAGVHGCYAGKGELRVHTVGKPISDKTIPFMWLASRDATIDRVAVAVCAEAIVRGLN